MTDTQIWLGDKYKPNVYFLLLYKLPLLFSMQTSGCIIRNTLAREPYIIHSIFYFISFPWKTVQGSLFSFFRGALITSNFHGTTSTSCTLHGTPNHASSCFCFHGKIIPKNPILFHIIQANAP